MMLKTKNPSIPVLLALAALVACGGKKLDLGPVATGSGVSAYCRIDEKKQLVISISNQGEGLIRATSTLLQFGSGPQIVLPTRPIAVGAVETVRFPMPRACRSDGCRFRIMLDGRNEVDETDESNNVVEGECQAGP